MSQIPGAAKLTQKAARGAGGSPQELAVEAMLKKFADDSATQSLHATAPQIDLRNIDNGEKQAAE
eukprot:9392742-Pyramimonas_sp.AAC.1